MKSGNVVALAIVFPFAVLALTALHAWEWWHFGPSGAFLRLLRGIRKAIIDWRISLEDKS